MIETNEELRLFKLIDTDEEDLIEEFGWISSEEFCVWVNYYNLDDFMNEIKDIFGFGMFDDGGFDANMQTDGVCIDLCEMICNYGIDFEKIFPKDKYKH